MRNRATVTVDDESRIILIRVVGNVDGGHFVDMLMERFADIEDPWAYAHLLDFRHKESMTLSSDVERLGAWWEKLRAGRCGERTAVVSTDVLLHARQNFMKAVFPDRTIQIFGTLDEGLDWLKSRESLRRAG